MRITLDLPDALLRALLDLSAASGNQLEPYIKEALGKHVQVCALPVPDSLDTLRQRAAVVRQMYAHALTLDPLDSYLVQSLFNSVTKGRKWGELTELERRGLEGLFLCAVKANAQEAKDGQSFVADCTGTKSRNLRFVTRTKKV